MALYLCRALRSHVSHMTSIQLTLVMVVLYIAVAVWTWTWLPLLMYVLTFLGGLMGSRYLLRQQSLFRTDGTIHIVYNTYKWLLKLASPDGHYVDDSQLRSRMVKEEVDKFVDLISRDFVKVWYDLISNNSQCMEEASQLLTSLLQDSTRRIGKAGRGKLIPVLLTVFRGHVKGYQASVHYLKMQPAYRKKKDPSKIEFKKVKTIEEAFEKQVHFHTALYDEETEVQYVRAVTRLLLATLAPDKVYKTESATEMLVEILACNMLLPLVAKLSDTHTLHRCIVAVLSDEEPEIVQPLEGSISQDKTLMKSPDSDQNQGQSASLPLDGTPVQDGLGFEQKQELLKGSDSNSSEAENTHELNEKETHFDSEQSADLQEYEQDEPESDLEKCGEFVSSSLGQYFRLLPEGNSSPVSTSTMNTITANTTSSGSSSYPFSTLTQQSKPQTTQTTAVKTTVSSDHSPESKPQKRPTELRLDQEAIKRALLHESSSDTPFEEVGVKDMLTVSSSRSSSSDVSRSDEVISSVQGQGSGVKDSREATSTEGTNIFREASRNVETLSKVGGNSTSKEDSISSSVSRKIEEPHQQGSSFLGRFRRQNEKSPSKSANGNFNLKGPSFLLSGEQTVEAEKAVPQGTLSGETFSHGIEAAWEPENDDNNQQSESSDVKEGSSVLTAGILESEGEIAVSGITGHIGIAQQRRPLKVHWSDEENQQEVTGSAVPHSGVARRQATQGEADGRANVDRQRGIFTAISRADSTEILDRPQTDRSPGHLHRSASINIPLQLDKADHQMSSSPVVGSSGNESESALSSEMDSVSVEDIQSCVSNGQATGVRQKRIMRQRQVVTTTEVPNFIFQNVYITQTETATEPSFTSNKPYTLYKIEYEAWYLTEEEEFILQKKVVWRRFREFVNLHSRLENSDLYKKCIKDVKGPKKWLTMPFGIGNMGQENIDSRKSTLEVYLQTLCAKSELNTSAEMREFLAYAGDGNIAFVKKPPQVTQIDKVIVKTVSGVFDKLDKLVTVPTREKRAKLESTSPTTAADVELPEDTDALRIRSKAESEDQVLMTTALEELVSSHEAVGNEDGTVTCKDQRAASAGTEMLLSRLKHQLSIQEENKDLKLQDETLSSQPAAPVKNCDPNEKLSPGKSDKPQGSIFGKKMKDMTSNPGFLEDVNSDAISPLTNTDEVKNLKDCTVLDEPNATCLLTESRNVDHVSKSTEHVTATDQSKTEGEDLLDMTSQSESLLQTDIAQTAKDCTKVDPSKALLLTDLVVDLGLQTIDGSTSWVCYDLAISAFRTLLGRGVESFLQEAVASITTEERCAHYLQNLRELLWHDGKRPGDQEQPIISQMQYDVTRKQAERCLYEAYPGFLALLLDDEDLSMSVREIMATLDSVKLNKHLLFCLADALLEQLLPEVKTEELHIKLFKLDTRPPDGAT